MMKDIFKLLTADPYINGWSKIKKGYISEESRIKARKKNRKKKNK